VVLGRAGAMCCRGRPDALHVRLDGPPEARLRTAVQRYGRAEEEVRPRDAGLRQDPRGLRAALLRCDTRRGAALPPCRRRDGRCRWRPW
jgi:hypothetical protein